MALASGPSAKKTFMNALSLVRRKGLGGLLSRMAQTKDFDNLGESLHTSLHMDLIFGHSCAAGGTFKGMDQLGNEYYEDKTNINGAWILHLS